MVHHIVVDKDPSEIQSMMEQIKTSALPEDVKQFTVKCVELALWLPIFLQKKAISIHRLRTMIFGKGYNQKDLNNTTSSDSIEPPESTSSMQETATETSESHSTMDTDPGHATTPTITSNSSTMILVPTDHK